MTAPSSSSSQSSDKLLEAAQTRIDEMAARKENRLKHARISDLNKLFRNHGSSTLLPRRKSFVSKIGTQAYSAFEIGVLAEIS